MNNIMNDTIKEKFKNVDFNEQDLKGMFVQYMVSVLVVGEPKDISDYKVFWEVLDCYKNYIDPFIHFYFYSKARENETLKEIISSYGLEKHVNFIDQRKLDEVLLHFLGCDMAILMGDVPNDYLDMMDYFYLPLLSMDKEYAESNKNVFYTTKKPEVIASSIKVISKNSDYKAKFIKNMNL